MGRNRGAVRDPSTSLGMTRREKGKLPLVVDLAFVSRVWRCGNGSKRAATGEGDFGQRPKQLSCWLRVEGGAEGSELEVRGRKSEVGGAAASASIPLALSA